jgi:hypothetical protein
VISSCLKALRSGVGNLDIVFLVYQGSPDDIGDTHFVFNYQHS